MANLECINARPVRQAARERAEAMIRSVGTGLASDAVNVLRLAAHIDALAAEVERLRAREEAGDA